MRSVEGFQTAASIGFHRVTVEFLDGETILVYPIDGKTTCSAVWSRVSTELVSRGVVHPQIFGLAIRTGSDWVYVDPEAKLSKYFPKEEWKSSTSQNNPGSSNSNATNNTNSISNHQQSAHSNGNGNGPQHGQHHQHDGKTLVLYCRVHFYLDTLPQNLDAVSLSYYYIQLRGNLIANPRYPPASVVQPVALAIQSELGDWRPRQEIPQWASNLKLSLSSLTVAHQGLAGLSKNAARITFIKQVIPIYNMHLYYMTLRTKDENSPAWIGVTPKGIEVYQNSTGEIHEQPKLTFLWANITKLYFERKKFEIRGRACPWVGSTQKLSFSASSESVPRHLLLLCRSTHQFHLSNHKILLAELTHKTASLMGSNSNVGSNSTSENNTNGHTNFSSTPNLSTTASQQQQIQQQSGHNGVGASGSNCKNDEKLDLSLYNLSSWTDGLLAGESNCEHQRVSVISNASSNTTSGIVSDRVYSLDGSEEDLDMREISDCCHERRHRTNNSTSLESLNQKHPPPPRRLASSSTKNISNSTTSNMNNYAKTQVLNGNGNSDENDNEQAKYWYCDSDCEEDDHYADDGRGGPCRSLLVRTIGEKITSCSSANHCECNSCLADDLDGLELGIVPSSTSTVDLNNLEIDENHHGQHHHTNTPSMASEMTLKAIDFSLGALRPDESSIPSTSSCNSSCESKESSLEKKPKPDNLKKSISDKNNSLSNNNSCKDKVLVQKVTDNNCSNSRKSAKVVNGHCNADDLSNEVMPKKTEIEGSYSGGSETGVDSGIDEKITTSSSQQNSSSNASTCTNNSKNSSSAARCKQTTRYCCSKQQQQHDKSLLLTNGKISKKATSLNPRLSSTSSSNCGKWDKTVKSGPTEYYSGTNNVVINSSTTKPNNSMSPKVASLKCLKSQKVISSQKHFKSPTKGLNMNLNSIEDECEIDQNYLEYKLQQGKYPSTRTVSDNFNTDSDYVQLPPLLPKLFPKKSTSKLWKFVSNKNRSSGSLNVSGSSGNLNNSHCHQGEYTLNSTISSISSINTSTLPALHHGGRRRSDSSHSISDVVTTSNQNGSNIQKISSVSTTALNSILSRDIAPEPPPKPRKSSTNNVNIETKAVDARFISTKPPILVQTAYATRAAIAIPLKAQILFSTSAIHHQQVPSTCSTLTPLSNLQHSQSVDNIYDTVACEDNFVPMPMSMTNSNCCNPPPPYPTTATTTVKPSSNTPIIRPNNYVDVHASNKAYPSTTTLSTTTACHNGNYQYAGAGTPIDKSKCGSVPNNLNKFFTGLSNLKPLSRSPIVHPQGATNTNTGSPNTANNQNNYSSNVSYPGPPPPPKKKSLTTDDINPPPLVPRATVYTNQLSRSQIQQFKAQLYSDMDYVIFPTKDRRQSQQEYYDSKSLSYASIPVTQQSLSNGNLNMVSSNVQKQPQQQLQQQQCTYQMSSEIQYLPPPPPYLSPNSVHSQSSNYQKPSGIINNQNSYQSLYNSTNASQSCNSSQYGYYAISNGINGGLNVENLQRFLSTQSLAGSNNGVGNGNGITTPNNQIYYPSSLLSTQSAPPLPPYNNKHGNSGPNHKQQQDIIENGMRKALQQALGNKTNEELLRLNLCRSDESIYSLPNNLTEEKLQAIYCLPSPPPYPQQQQQKVMTTTTRPPQPIPENVQQYQQQQQHQQNPKPKPIQQQQQQQQQKLNSPVRTPQSSNPSHATAGTAAHEKQQSIGTSVPIDLASLRAKCTTMELPLLKALCSDGALLNISKQPTTSSTITNTPTSSRSVNVGQNSRKTQQQQQTTAPQRPPKPTSAQPQVPVTPSSSMSNNKTSTTAN